MTGRRRICFVVTARPSYPRIRSAMERLRGRGDVELQVVLVASALLERYGRVEQVIERDGFSVSWRITSILDGETLLASAKSTGIGLMETATAFANLRPDAVVTIADRFETIATAIAAAYQNIPLVHVQGGELSGNIDDKVRHAITKLADLHLVSSEGAAARVISMGEDADRVINTGCPSVDIASAAREAPPIGAELFDRAGGTGDRFDLSEPFIIVMQHPVTTEHDRAFAQVTETLQAIRDVGIPALWFSPNLDAGADGTSRAIREFRVAHGLPGIHFLRSLPPEDFNRLLVDAVAIVGNSSVAIRECAFLGTPAVNIGSRQSGRERGPNVIDVEHDRAAIREAIRTHLAHGRYPSSQIYGDGTAGRQIADVLATWPLILKAPGR